MWKRFATFVLTASLSAAATAAGAVADDSFGFDDSDGRDAAVSINTWDWPDAELIDDAVDDRLAAWVSLRHISPHVSAIHIESLAASNRDVIEQLLTAALKQVHSTDTLKVLIDPPPVNVMNEADLCDFLTHRGLQFHRARTLASARVLEFYSNLYYQSKEQPNTAA